MTNKTSSKPFPRFSWLLFIAIYLISMGFLITGAALFFLSPLFIPAIITFVFGMLTLTSLEIHHAHYESCWAMTHVFHEVREEGEGEGVRDT